MTTRFVSTIAAGIFAVLIATPGFTCTTLCLFEKGRALVAYNYDAWASEGLVTSSSVVVRPSWSPIAAATFSGRRPVATTEWPAARAALAISTPNPRPAPVISQTFFLVMCRYPPLVTRPTTL